MLVKQVKETTTDKLNKDGSPQTTKEWSYTFFDHATEAKHTVKTKWKLGKIAVGDGITPERIAELLKEA